MLTLTNRQRDLIESQLELPSRVVRSVVKAGDVEEAGSEAQMALVDAALAFEDQCEFGSFAFNRIRWHLLSWLRKKKGHSSLDQLLPGEDGCTLGNITADENTLRPDQLAEQNEQKERIIKTLKKKGSIRLTECRERTPAPVKLGDYYQQMREKICDSVNGDDVQDIMQALVARAKNGDVAAAKLVLQQVAGPAAPRVTQTIEVKQVTLSDLDDSEDER
jgi:DNA-directed RNA polymerase specialized sigma24 family protein